MVNKSLDIVKMNARKPKKFFRYCDEDMGGCGEKFHPKGPFSKLCYECYIKRRKLGVIKWKENQS